MPASLRKSPTACDAWPAPPPTPITNRRPPPSRLAASPAAIASIAPTSIAPAIRAVSRRKDSVYGWVMARPEAILAADYARLLRCSRVQPGDAPGAGAVQHEHHRETASRPGTR